MQNFIVKFIPEVVKELKKIDNSARQQIQAGILKVSSNPLPSPNGYGKPLGDELTGFFKIKYKGIGYRVVYTLALKEGVMNIVTVSKREDEACYVKASEILKKYGDDLFQDKFHE